MTIKISAKLVGFDKELFDRDLRKRLLTATGLECRNVIHDRIDRGQTPRGAKFRKYSNSYEAYKRKKGRNPYTPGDWLVWTGQMLNSHQLSYVDADRFVLSFVGGRTDGSSNAEVAYRNNLTRKFVALAAAEKNYAIDQAIKHAKLKGWL